MAPDYGTPITTWLDALLLAAGTEINYALSENSFYASLLKRGGPNHAAQRTDC
jgi:hypothetical protein